MASNAGMSHFRKVQSLEDLLTCPVCLDSLQDPRTLACLHTFCTNCLEGCRKQHRRDFECPVCKRLTSLSSHGIQGLPIDHRIQQIRDIVNQSARMQGQRRDGVQARWPSAENSQSCDLCRTQHRKITATTCHCIQCFMYFCESCTKKHDGNPLFAGHDRILMQDSSAVETLFCRQHKEQPVRYFCKVCHLLLCTICTMDHDPSHLPEALEKGVIEKYRHHLQESLMVLASKLKEVKTKAKCLETLRQTHQGGLYQVQALIRERAEHYIAKIREQERKLLQDAQIKFDTKMKGCGMEKMAEMTFFKTNLESLLTEMQQVLKGSPQICLLRYDDLINRFSSISETALPSLGRYKTKKAIKFVPSSEELDLMIGTLQEINIDDDLEKRDDENGSQSPTTTGDLLMPMSQMEFGVCSPHLRKRMILNAVSPMRKDIKISRMKTVNKPSTSTAALEVFVTAGASSMQKDTVDGAIKESETEVTSGGSSATDQVEQSSLPSSPSSTTSDGAAIMSSAGARLLFSIEQVGGMPGKITSPSSVAFLPNGNIVIAECEHRLQVFDSAGQSVRVIGWGKIRPQGVVVTPGGLIACTDKKEQTVKIYQSSGEPCESWPQRMFSMPFGIAVSSCGNFVVSDVDRSSVSTHGPRGNVGLTITQSISQWPDVSQRFNSPEHVAVDRNDNIYVSDPSQSSVQTFDKTGKFVSRFVLPPSRSGTWYNSQFRPQGLCIDPFGNVAVCDVENHRISLFSPDGVYLTDLLTQQNGLKYPCNVAFSFSGTEVAVVESHRGILTNNPHQAVKLFSLA